MGVGTQSQKSSAKSAFSRKIQSKQVAILGRVRKTEAQEARVRELFQRELVNGAMNPGHGGGAYLLRERVLNSQL